MMVGGSAIAAINAMRVDGFNADSLLSMIVMCIIGVAVVLVFWKLRP